MRKLKLFKSLLVVAMLLVGGVSSVWAAVVETVVVNQDFNDGTTTLFTEASRITVDNDNNARFTTADNSTNGYSLATYDFSSAIGEGATSVKIEFDYYIYNDNSAFHRYFTIGDKSRRTGFGKQSYVTSGGMFAFGLKRGKFNGAGSNVNYWSINDGSTANTTANIIGAWAHVEVTINISAKTSTYKFTSIDGNTVYYSGTDVAYMDGSASTCNQIDFFDCANSVSSYLDNLKITKYVDDSKEATTYTVKYQNAGGDDLKDAVVYDTYVGDTYTASASDMATFYSTDTNTKYVYKSGNTSATATSTAASNVITLVFDEYTKYTATASAVSGGSSLQSNIASVTTYKDETAYLRLPKYLKVGSAWYVTETSNVLQTATAAGNTEVEYTVSDIDYFFEETDFTLSHSFAATTTKDFFSRGNGGRLYANSYGTTEALEGGVYELVIAGAINTQTPTMTYGYKLDDADYVVLGESPSFSNGSFEATKTVNNVVIPDGARFCWINNTEYNSNLYIDYITLTKVNVPVTITSAGWATLYTPYALNFDGTGLTAYTATCSGNTVTLATVTDVPANTGVVLKGAEGDYSIPVIASSSTDKGDLTGNATEATAYDEGSGSDLYMLALSDDGKKVQFTKLISGSIDAGKAYLQIAKNAARMLSVVFDDGDATGISNATAEMKAEDAIFNLAGQRVAQPANGLYIVNGKKVLVK